MKYFVQFEGKEKLWVKFIIIVQIVITLLLVKIAFRPVELYIDDKQLKEIVVWLAKEQDSSELVSTENEELLSD